MKTEGWLTVVIIINEFIIGVFDLFPFLLQDLFRILRSFHRRWAVVVQFSIAHRVRLGSDRPLAPDGW